MPSLIKTIWTSKKTIESSDSYIGHSSDIWYDVTDGILKYSDGVTPGGIPIAGSGGEIYRLPTATVNRLGGVKIGRNINVSLDGTISVSIPTNVSSFNNDSNYITIDSLTWSNIQDKPDLEAEMAYARRTDFVGDTIVYKGDAIPGTLDNSAAWRIRKLTINDEGDVTEEWANGNANYVNKWSDRATYQYS